MPIYYTPVLKRTTNTEPVSGVQYLMGSRPPLTLPGRAMDLNPQFSLIFAYLGRIFP